MALTAKERRTARKGKKKSALRKRFEYNQKNQKVYIPKSARRGGVKVAEKHIPPAEREIAETRRSDGGKVHKHDDSDGSQTKVINKVKKELKRQKDLKIGQQLAKQNKKDDKDIAEAKKNPKKTYNTKGQEVEAVYQDGKYVTRVKEDSKKPDLKPKETEAEARKKWEKKTRNSPARRSGAWDADELWEKQKKHRKWESDRKEGKLKREKFNPRAPRGTQRKLVQKTPAEIAKAKLRKAKNDPTSMKAGKNKAEEERKKKVGFNANSNKPGI